MIARIALMLTTLVPGAGIAGTTWEQGLARGLDTYAATAEGGRVTVACDPDRVHGGSPQGTVVVLMPTDRGADRAVFLAETGEQAAFDLRDGVAAQAVHPEAWTALGAMMRTGGRIAVVTARDAFTLDLAPLPSLRCG